MPWSSRVFGSPPMVPLPQDLEPIAQIIVQWEWSNPLAAILKFGGWTIDEAVSDTRVSTAIRQLWRVFKTSKRYAVERERRIRLWEQIQWRLEGLPVPCPICASLEACSCPLAPLILKTRL